MLAALLLLLLIFYTLLCIALFPYLNLAPSPPPHDHHSSTLADFFDRPASSKFFFGLATAPAHVEDRLDDTWLHFARGTDDRKPVRAWHNTPFPDERLRFWTEPDVELKLAKEAGVTVFRLGIDWGRIIGVEPVHGTAQTANKEAVEHYRRILKKVHQHGMQVMLTLFHHSLPKWASSYGGWTDKRTITYFVEFARFSKEQFGNLVDYWVTFNEPHIFVLLSHCSGVWPPGERLSTVRSLICFSPYGEFGKAMSSIISAHVSAYNVLHEGDSKTMVGVAHHVGVISPYGLLDVPIVLASRWLTQFHWIDRILNHLDFCGLNYYGQEILSASGLILAEDEEYSEAGRGVYPNGLYELLVAFHKRYKDQRPMLRYIITENGFADARDILRRPYIVEHLLALDAAIRQGVPVDGYIHWTVSDNWEWADGYCPKFGLVNVDRANNLTRYPRHSYYLYKKIAETGVVTAKQREIEWETLQKNIKEGGIRPFCRATDQFSRMWAESLDQPTMRSISSRDWRFGNYEPHGLLTYVCRSFTVAKIMSYDCVQLLFGYVEAPSPSELLGGEL